jgi:hypothetical protein
LGTPITWLKRKLAPISRGLFKHANGLVDEIEAIEISPSSQNNLESNRGVPYARRRTIKTQSSPDWVLG